MKNDTKGLVLSLAQMITAILYGFVAGRSHPGLWFSWGVGTLLGMFFMWCDVMKRRAA